MIISTWYESVRRERVERISRAQGVVSGQFYGCLTLAKEFPGLYCDREDSGELSGPAGRAPPEPPGLGTHIRGPDRSALCAVLAAVYVGRYISEYQYFLNISKYQ